MDRRLYEAARTGDINSLHNLLGDDPLILETAMLEGGETPLHVSMLAGKLDFVCEIMKRRPSFSKELNRDGLAPLHIASAKGSLELVRELLNSEPSELCLLKGKERRIPLHYAAIKGRVKVIRELVSSCDKSIEEVTARGETALHLAVKNNQFEALVALVEHLDDTNKRSILNREELEGNTIMHLAVAAKQYEVVNFLLSGDSPHKELVDLNVVNRRGLTPLDILSVVPSEAGDQQIGDILTRAGARARVGEHGQSSNFQLVEARSSAKITTSPLNKKDQAESPNDWLEKMSNGLMIVAILTATVAFQVGVSPPGGFWENSSSKHSAGSSVFAEISPILYPLFLMFDTVTLVTALSVILLLISGLPLQRKLYVWVMMVVMWISVSCLTVTFGLSIFGVMRDDDIIPPIIATGVIVLWLLLIFVLLVAHTVRVARKVRNRKTGLNSTTLDAAV